ncbi:hypothetical protein CC78DRAFT_601103, partial [Lojkania enalia]
SSAIPGERRCPESPRPLDRVPHVRRDVARAEAWACAVRWTWLGGEMLPSLAGMCMWYALLVVVVLDASNSLRNYCIRPNFDPQEQPPERSAFDARSGEMQPPRRCPLPFLIPHFMCVSRWPPLLHWLTRSPGTLSSKLCTTTAQAAKNHPSSNTQMGGLSLTARPMHTTLPSPSPRPS